MANPVNPVARTNTTFLGIQVPSGAAALSNVGSVFSRCTANVAYLSSAAASLTSRAITGTGNEIGRVWRHGALGYALIGQRSLPEGAGANAATQEIWDLYQENKGLLMGHVHGALNLKANVLGRVLTPEAVEHAIDQTVYALLVGVQNRLADEGKEPTLEAILLHIASALKKSKEANNSLNVLFDQLIGGMGNLPSLSGIAKCILPLASSCLEFIPMDLLSEGVDVLEKLSQTEEEARLVLEGTISADDLADLQEADDQNEVDRIKERICEKLALGGASDEEIADVQSAQDVAGVLELVKDYLSSENKVSLSLQAAYGDGGEDQAVQDAKHIKDFISHLLNSALVKVNFSEDMLSHLLGALAPSLREPSGQMTQMGQSVVKIGARILGSSAVTQNKMNSLLTAVLMNLADKFILANPEKIKDHKAGGVVVALTETIGRMIPQLQAASRMQQGTYEREDVFQNITGELAKCFGIETAEDVAQILAPLVPEGSAEKLNNFSKEYVSKLLESFFDHASSILEEGPTLRQRTQQLFGTSAQEDLDDLTPAEFAAKQVGDFTARLLPVMLEDDKKMLAESTIGSLNGQFKAYIGEDLLSPVGAKGPQAFLEATFEAAGQNFPRQAPQFIGEVVNNVCLKAFCMIGDEIKKIEERQDAKEFVLGLVSSSLRIVKGHFEAINKAQKEGRGRDLLRAFADSGQLDAALGQDAAHIETYAGNPEALRQALDETRLQEFYQPIFGKLLLELGNITEEIVPVDPLLKGVLFDLVKDTVLPSVLQTVFNTFLDGKNLNKLLITVLRGQEQSLRELTQAVEDAARASQSAQQAAPGNPAAPSQELQDDLQGVIAEVVAAFPTSLTAVLINLVNSDLMEKKGMIAPLAAQAIEGALIDPSGKPKLLDLLNFAFSLTDLRKTAPDAPIAETAEEIEAQAVLNGMSQDELKKTLRKEMRKIIQTGLDVTWKKLSDEFQKIGASVADWLETNVHSIAATLFKGFWSILSAALYIAISPFWIVGKLAVLIFSWRKARSLVEGINMPIHENMVLKAVRKLMEDLLAAARLEREESAQSEADSEYDWSDLFGEVESSL